MLKGVSKMLHFGVVVLPGKKGLKLTRENYAIINNKNTLLTKKEAEFRISVGMLDPNRKQIINEVTLNRYADESCLFYSDEWCKQHFINCIKNFDLNMDFFKQLDENEFNLEIDSFLNVHTEFQQINDLNDLDKTPGYYMMVLDEYKQIYIGTSENIKKRIRQHWASSKSFDRLLFPQNEVLGSVLSIDSFRSLDTTRIYAMQTSETFDHENSFIEFFNPKFISNRLAGGNLTDLSFVELLGEVKKRDFK